MNKNHKHHPPEQIELEKKKSELTELESKLSDLELELATVNIELSVLQKMYSKTVGIKFSILDDLLAQLAEKKSHQKPDDQNLKTEAENLRSKARQTAKETSKFEDIPIPKAFKPSSDLKELFRDAAKEMHPDLAENDEDRQLRNDYMARANEAYANGDIDKLNDILTEWRSNPNRIKGSDIGSELVRVIRQIDLVKRRIDSIKNELENILKSDLYVLFVKVQEAEKEGRDLLSEMTKKIEQQIKVAEERLSNNS